jgi:uncharacterized protein YqgQ
MAILHQYNKHKMILPQANSIAPKMIYKIANLLSFKNYNHLILFRKNWQSIKLINMLKEILYARKLSKETYLQRLIG